VVPVLTEMVLAYFICFTSILILSTHLPLEHPNVHVPSGLENKILYALYISRIHTIRSANPILLDFDSPNNAW
jgi:hypothetical protein